MPISFKIVSDLHSFSWGPSLDSRVRDDVGWRGVSYLSTSHSSQSERLNGRVVVELVYNDLRVSHLRGAVC